MDRADIADIVFPRAGRRAVVLCGGAPPEAGEIARWLDGAELFVAADGAALARDDLPRPLDAVVGDLDSLPAGFDPDTAPPLLARADQSASDSEKTLRHVLEQGCEEAVLLGATGLRLDHTLYNCVLMEVYAGRLRLCLANASGLTVRVGANETVEWPLETGTRFSLSPAGGRARVVRLEGAAWPLSSEVIGAGGRFSLSNRVMAPPLRLRIGSGAVLATVIHEPGVDA